MDSLQTVLSLSNALGFSSNRMETSFGPCREGCKQMFCVHFLITVILHMYYLWYVINIRENMLEEANIVYNFMLEVESNLWFARCYIIILNGLANSKKCSNLVNISLKISQIIQTMLKKPNLCPILTNRRICISAGTVVMIDLFLINGLFAFYGNFADSLIYLSIDVLFVLLGTVNDMYLFMFNVFVIKIGAECDCIEMLLKKENRSKTVLVVFNMHSLIISQFNLLTQCYAIPLMFNSMLLFYEGTLVLFRLYCMMTDLWDQNQAMSEIANYCIWFVPFALKMSITMKLATLTCKKVSTKIICFRILIVLSTES